MVIWIIGLSASGKSTVAEMMYKKIKSKKKIILDGDDIRLNFYPRLGYSPKNRLQNSNFIFKLSKFLSNKDFIVIVPILSIFQKHRDRNRKKINNYIEIYIKSNSIDILNRDFKKVYKNQKNIVGRDIKFEEPINYDYLINNDNSINYLKKEVDKILKKINVI